MYLFPGIKCSPWRERVPLTTAQHVDGVTSIENIGPICYLLPAYISFEGTTEGIEFIPFIYCFLCVYIYTALHFILFILLASFLSLSIKP
jgi:hypothetical protein